MKRIAEIISSKVSPPVWASVEAIELICPECAEKMKKLSIKRINVRPILAAKWETLPRGWTKKSLESFWEGVGGSVTKCIKKMEGVVDDPGAFCAALKDRIEGTEWRHEKRKND